MKKNVGIEELLVRPPVVDPDNEGIPKVPGAERLDFLQHSGLDADMPCDQIRNLLHLATGVDGIGGRLGIGGENLAAP